MPRLPSVLSVVVLLTLAGCSTSGPAVTPVPSAAQPTVAPVATASPAVTPTLPGAVREGTIPPLLSASDLYAADRPGRLAPEARLARSLVYVPDDDDGTVHVIDPATYRVVAVQKVSTLPQHVTPSWDLKTLWVDNDKGNSLTPIDPRTGTFGAAVPVADPYNLYFTADGRSAVVVAERLGRLDFRDPHTMVLQQSVPVPCKGIDHADFSPDGTHALFSCEFSGQLVWMDMQHRTVEKVITLPRETGGRPKPQDVKISPDGKVFYVADEVGDGCYLVDARTLTVTDFLPTGLGAHGLYVSRDSKDLYVTNRLGASVSVVSFATRKVRTI